MCAAQCVIAELNLVCRPPTSLAPCWPAGRAVSQAEYELWVADCFCPRKQKLTYDAVFRAPGLARSVDVRGGVWVVWVVWLCVGTGARGHTLHVGAHADSNYIQMKACFRIPFGGRVFAARVHEEFKSKLKRRRAFPLARVG